MKDNLIKSVFYSTLFYSLAYPSIQKIVIEAISYKLIALNSIIICIGTIIIGHAWNKYKDFLYKYYLFFLILEIICYMAAIFGAIVFNSYFGYYLADTLIFATISKNIIIGANTLKARKYNEEEIRNKYDNNVQIYASIATLIGSGLCLLIELPIWLSFIAMFLGVSIDNIFYGIEYLKIKNVKKIL
jgi:hypothetical protein